MNLQIRGTLAWLCAALALAGLAAVASAVGVLVGANLSDRDPPGGWMWFAVGWLGLLGVLVFGTLAVTVSGRSQQTAVGGPAPATAIRARRAMLSLIGAVSLVAGLVLVGQAFAPIPTLVLLAVAALAFYEAWRRPS